MHILSRLYKICTVVILLLGMGNICAQRLNTFAEYGLTVHAGKNTPIWQTGNQHWLSLINNNTYKGWCSTASVAFDMDNIYGDNLGFLKFAKKIENELYTDRN